MNMDIRVAMTHRPADTEGCANSRKLPGQAVVLVDRIPGGLRKIRIPCLGRTVGWIPSPRAVAWGLGRARIVGQGSHEQMLAQCVRQQILQKILFVS
jgi:hypothetical protein